MDKKHELKAEELAAEALRIFNYVQSLRLDLSDDDAMYDLTYIGKMTAMCASIMEKVSDAQMQITKLGLEARKWEHGASLVLREEERKLINGKGYKENPISARKDWLKMQLQPFIQEVEVWDQVSKSINEVKETVNERMSTVKRLDSDVRLHHKLYETKVASGMIGKPGLVGKKAESEDL